MASDPAPPAPPEPPAPPMPPAPPAPEQVDEAESVLKNLSPAQFKEELEAALNTAQVPKKTGKVVKLLYGLLSLNDNELRKHISWNEHGTGFFLNKKTIEIFYFDKVQPSGFLDGTVSCFKKQLSQLFIVEEGLPMSMYTNPHFKRGSPAALVNVKELPVASRSRNARAGNMNPPPSNPPPTIRTVDMKIDNLGRELREELKGVESKVMEKMTSVESNILDAIKKSE